MKNEQYPQVKNPSFRGCITHKAIRGDTVATAALVYEFSNPHQASIARFEKHELELPRYQASNDASFFSRRPELWLLRHCMRTVGLGEDDLRRKTMTSSGLMNGLGWANFDLQVGPNWVQGFGLQWARRTVQWAGKEICRIRAQREKNHAMPCHRAT